MKRGVTIKDIAAKLNMSVSTVSKSLNDDPTISAATKERVKQLATEWNYIPNEAARNLKLNKTFTLGLIIPSMMDQFYTLAINGAEKLAGLEKYQVIVSQTHEDAETEERIVDLMKRTRVDGVIVVITKARQDMSIFRTLEDIGIPVVFFSRPPADDIFDYVSSDNEGGAFKATDFLVKKGHKRIGHLMGPASMPVSQMRLLGYKRALEENGMPFDNELVKAVDLTETSTQEAIEQFMEMKDAPTAIFAFKNYITLDAIEYLKSNHPKKLKQIDFTGFGNLPLFRYLDHKPIAIIEESAYEMGEAAAALLLDILRMGQPFGVRVAQHVKLNCRLVTEF